MGGPFICHSIIRKWQSKVFGHLAASGERGQLREPSDDKRSFSAPLIARKDLLRKHCRLGLYSRARENFEKLISPICFLRTRHDTPTAFLELQAPKSNETEISGCCKIQVTDFTTIAKSTWKCASQRVLPLESLVKASCVETPNYSGYKHWHNYGLTATTSQLLPGAFECLVR